MAKWHKMGSSHERRKRFRTRTIEHSIEIGTPAYSPIQAKYKYTTQNELAGAIMASGTRKRRTRRRKDFLHR